MRFFNVTPHGKYTAHIRGSSIPNAQRWLDSADGALQRPQPLRLPSRVRLAANSEPLAPWTRGFITSRPGYVVEAAADQLNEVFIYVFRKVEDEFQPLARAGQVESAVTVEIPCDGEYIVRVHPTLQARSGMVLAFHSEPTLALSVQAQNPQAFKAFGAVRGGGHRSHQGVDFAQHGTPGAGRIRRGSGYRRSELPE